MNGTYEFFGCSAENNAGGLVDLQRALEHVIEKADVLPRQQTCTGRCKPTIQPSTRKPLEIAWPNDNVIGTNPAHRNFHKSKPMPVVMNWRYGILFIIQALSSIKDGVT